LCLLRARYLEALAAFHDAPRPLPQFPNEPGIVTHFAKAERHFRVKRFAPGCERLTATAALPNIGV
jgi:hypothetical protein